MSRGKAKTKKAKAPKYTLVEEKDPAWKILEEVVGKHHSHLAEAKIALVYEHDMKADRDGHMVLGRARKVGKLERSFREHDFTILLNAQAWAVFPESAKRALLDHEHCHCGSKSNDAGERTYYIRKHDLEEFEEVVRRHGIWRSDVLRFVNAALEREQRPLFPDEKPEEAPASRTKKVTVTA